MTRFASTPVRIAFDDVGTAEPGLLFLSGWCANRTVFEDPAAESGRHRRVLALDWRAHGGSAPFSEDFGERELLEDTLAVIEASGVRRVVPVALAQAGWVAIELRRRLGATVPKLVLMEWPILEAPPPFQEGGASGCAVGRTMARDRRTDVPAMVARCEKPQVNRFCPGRDGLLRL